MRGRYQLVLTPPFFCDVAQGLCIDHYRKKGASAPKAGAAGAAPAKAAAPESKIATKVQGSATPSADWKVLQKKVSSWIM